MNRVYEGVHGLGRQGWSMHQGSMFCIHPSRREKFIVIFYTYFQRTLPMVQGCTLNRGYPALKG